MLHLRSRDRVLRQRLAHVKNTKGDHAVAEEASTSSSMTRGPHPERGPIVREDVERERDAR